ncbi:hypothetical protein E4T49_02314 [Aureobasidium sp. EXF-10728]|nr:hypothetical protein E4T49_02314 [Aureobasidium sp. EXF-10728]
MSSHSTGPSKGAASTLDKIPSRPYAAATGSSLRTTHRKHFQGLVTIVVGTSKKEFAVHKDLLVFYSDYFRAAFDGSFVEAIDKKIELHDVEKDVFENFYGWLYTRKLVSEDDKVLGWFALQELWVFGDRFQAPVLQNQVIDEIIDKRERENGFDLGILKSAYASTHVKSPLRNALVNIMAHRMVIEDEDKSILADKYLEKFTPEILRDVLREVYATYRCKPFTYTMPKRDKCFFHVHGKDEHC